jgi:hypothetical protein
MAVHPGAEQDAQLTTDWTNRLFFLHHVIDDTQNTIRFLDTKAGFCVTLLSGMAALSAQRSRSLTPLQGSLRSLFLASVVVALLCCLRVIFPTITPATTKERGAAHGPKFFIGHNQAHRWLLHTLVNPREGVLSETVPSYQAELQAAVDESLAASLCEEAVMIAHIRQVKSDRLHAAMFCLVAAVLAFVAFELS